MNVVVYHLNEILVQILVTSGGETNAYGNSQVSAGLCECCGITHSYLFLCLFLIIFLQINPAAHGHFWFKE